MRVQGRYLRRLARPALLCAAALLVPACGRQSSPDKGSVEVSVRSLASQPVTALKVTVQAPDVLGNPVSLAVPFAGSQSSTLIRNLPVGQNYAIAVAAYGPGHDLVAQGIAVGVVIRRGATTKLIVYLNDLVAPTPFNHGPLIDALTLSADEIGPLGTITLAATAHDPDPGQTATLELSWQPLAGCGSLDGIGQVAGTDALAPSVSTATWTAPASDGNCQVAFTAKDALGLANSVTFTLRVRSGAGTGSADVVLAFNEAPNIVAITAAPAQLSSAAPTSGSLAAIVVDPEDDNLSYAWSADPSAPCTVVFEAPAASSTAFTASPAGPDATYCTFMVSVNDGPWPDTNLPKNRVAAVLILSITDPLVAQIPPTFGIGYQSYDVVGSGVEVVFGATAFDPAGGSLDYAWSASAGSAPEPQSPARLGLDPSFTTASTWTVPEGGVEAGMGYVVEVTATSLSSKLSSTASFALTPGTPE